MEAPAKLKAAIENNDLGALASELSVLSGSVDDYLVYSNPLILWAGAIGRPDVVKFLIDSGSNPRAIKGALHYVIFSGSHMSSWEEAKDVSALQHLIDAGCDPNGLDSNGDSALYVAGMTSPHPERAEAAARLLLKNGAELSRPENAGLLHRAVCTPASGVVAALLEAGADPNELNSGGITPALSCVMELHRALERSRNNPEDDSGEVASEFVAENLRLLVAHGADVSADSPDEVNPLQIVFTSQGSPESIKKILLDAGAPADGTVNAHGQEVDYLVISLLEGHSPELMARLYQAGCPIDEKYEILGGGSFLRLTPQHNPEALLAIIAADPTVLDSVLSFRTEKGFSLLIGALVSGNRKLIKLLIENGLSPDDKNPDGLSIRDYLASVEGGAPAIEVMEEMGL